MGDLLKPNPPQWQRKEPLEDIQEDRVLRLAGELKAQIDKEVDSTLVQLAALRLVLKAVVGNYRKHVGHEAAKVLMQQATEMCAQYEVQGIDEHPDT